MRTRSLRIVSPCPEDWDGMDGDARARHCARCDKVVTDLSAMTRGEATTLVAQPGAQRCVRVRVGADGRLLFAAALAVALAACTPQHHRDYPSARDAVECTEIGQDGCVVLDDYAAPDPPPRPRPRPRQQDDAPCASPGPIDIPLGATTTVMGLVADFDPETSVFDDSPILRPRKPRVRLGKPTIRIAD